MANARANSGPTTIGNVIAGERQAAGGKGLLGFITTGTLTEEGHASGDGYWLVARVRQAFVPLFGPLPGLKTIYTVLALMVLTGRGVRVAFRPTTTTVQQTLLDVSTLLLVGLFFVSPNYPWYSLAIVPFVVLGDDVPAWTISLTAILL